ncbi:MAG: hypothetical protein ACE5GW_12310 [Planctomycetota bacterium]
MPAPARRLLWAALAWTLLAPAALPAAGALADIVGLDLLFEEGNHERLSVIAGEAFMIDSIAILTTVAAPDDELLNALKSQSFLNGLDWSGLKVEREEWHPEQGGGFERQRFYRRAAWMGERHIFTVTVLDAAGNILSGPMELTSFEAGEPRPQDAFATRRFGAVTSAHGAPAVGDTTGATFTAQGLVQLRNGATEASPFRIPLAARILRVEWDHLPGQPLEVALSPVPAAAWDYGFQIDAEPAPPLLGSWYRPGETIAVEVAFRDGSGKRLHAAGSLPTYEEFITGQVESGLRYYDFFPAIVFYRDKNREGVLLAALVGPEHEVRQTHQAIPLDEFLFSDEQQAATVQAHGFTAIWRMIPPAPVVFGGPPLWSTPVSDTLFFTLPADALPGRYSFTIKARRAFRGEAALATTTRWLQVGPPSVPPPVEPIAGNCSVCHRGSLSLGRMLHANESTRTCTGCHLPLEFETNNLLPYRVHRIHNLSDRYTADRSDYTVCHLEPRHAVEDDARWLVCTSCHLPNETHNGNNYNGDLERCSNIVCHVDVHLFYNRDAGKDPVHRSSAVFKR